MPERDEWGETAKERYERILTRDLAWLAYAGGHARDGVPCTPDQELHFNGGWAAAYAEYGEARAALTRREAQIAEALALPHGPFGPWEDELVSWDGLVRALADPKPVQDTEGNAE